MSCARLIVLLPACAIVRRSIGSGEMSGRHATARHESVGGKNVLKDSPTTTGPTAVWSLMAIGIELAFVPMCSSSIMVYIGGSEAPASEQRAASMTTRNGAVRRGGNDVCMAEPPDGPRVLAALADSMERLALSSPNQPCRMRSR